MLDTILLIGACVCYGLAAFGIGFPKVNLVALGLLLFTLTFLI